MGFLFSLEDEPVPAPAPAPPEPDKEDDKETFETLQMMAKTLRDVGAHQEAEEVERQIDSLKRSLRKLSGDEAFSTVQSGEAQPEPAPAEASQEPAEASQEPAAAEQPS